MQNQTKKILKMISLIVFSLFIVTFTFLNSRSLILGVKIKNVNIKDNIKMTDKVVKITGIAKNARNLFLDGREISIDQKGNFEETLALLSGYNLINIKAEDKFGNLDEKNYKLIFN